MREETYWNMLIPKSMQHVYRYHVCDNTHTQYMEASDVAADTFELDSTVECRLAVWTSTTDLIHPNSHGSSAAAMGIPKAHYQFGTMQMQDQTL